MKRKLFTLFVALICLVGFEATGLAQCPNLPSDPVNALWVYPGGNSLFDVRFTGVGTGFGVVDNQTYLGWCLEENGSDPHSPVTLFCSYTPTLPGNLGTLPWDKVNYLLNHKQGTWQDVQAAIWLLTWGSSNFFPVTPAVEDMINDANANGVGFVPGAGQVVAIILYTGDGIGIGKSTWQETIIEVPVTEGGCRVTGGGNDTAGLDTITGGWDGTLAKGQLRLRAGEYDRYTFGGQAGANTALPPQPKGEWTHHQQSGPDGDFVFHAGTASAPPGTEIANIICSDPGYCNPARPAPFKQIDFDGVGTFKNIKNSRLTGVTPGVTYHYFQVHIEDLGEPGNEGRKNGFCGIAGSGTDAFADYFADADCDCADFYRIRIFEGVVPIFDPTTGQVTNLNTGHVIYEVFGYINGGNLQIHPLTGFDQ